jgi:type IV pilus assembly protein PilF
MRRPEVLLCCLLLAACASDGAREGPAVTAGVAKHEALSSDGRMNLALAETYLAKGDMVRTTERANKVLDSDPGSARAHALLALVHEHAGETEKAGRAFDRALALAPADGGILNAHASWLCEHGKPAEADREFALALADASYRTPWQALANAGKCALSAGRLAPAEDYLRRALVFAPADRTLLFLLADVELRQGKTFEAQAFVQRRDALGADGATLDLAARIEDAAGNPQGAARYRERLRKAFPDYAPTGEGARSP